MSDVVDELQGSRSLQVAVAEQLCRSMNGASARRYTWLLTDLASMDDDDRAWLADGIDRAQRTERNAFWSTELERLGQEGVQVVTAAESSYPTNLALVPDAPPVLFVRGTIEAARSRSVAIVGTRRASDAGCAIAYDLAANLARAGITILSGLARGIDTAAHSGALSARGTTVAVFGTTILDTYPAANRALARTIAASGACISQFLPGTRPGRWAFPARNITMSGLAVGTVVVEASDTSGARLQAEAALNHGKRVILLEHLVTRQEWAEALRDHPSVTVADDPTLITQLVEREFEPATMLV